MWLVVMPYLSVWGPPGSRRRCRRSCRRAGSRDRARRRGRGARRPSRERAFTTPGSTTAKRSTGSISTMRSMREHSITTPPPCATAPPERPVPAPRGTNGTPNSRQARTTRSPRRACSGAPPPWAARGAASGRRTRRRAALRGAPGRRSAPTIPRRRSISPDMLWRLPLRSGPRAAARGKRFRRGRVARGLPRRGRGGGRSRGAR